MRRPSFGRYAIEGFSPSEAGSLGPLRNQEQRRTMANTQKYVYSFGGGSAEGRADMKELLGGKGGNPAEMSLIGIPVPPGFTITTEVCATYYDRDRKLPEEVKPQVETALARMEEA